MNTQWLLSVELHQFHNWYNVEVIPDEGFCCCDVDLNGKNYKQFCNEEDKNLSGCYPYCDTWLNASVSHCIEPNACSFSTAVHFHTALMDNFNEKFIFALSSSSNAVGMTKT